MARADGNSPVPVASVTPSHLAGAQCLLTALAMGKELCELVFDGFLHTWLPLPSGHQVAMPKVNPNTNPLSP